MEKNEHVTNWALNNHATIQAHKAKPTPAAWSTGGMIFGESYASLATRLGGPYLPGSDYTKYTGGISLGNIYDAYQNQDWDMVIDDAIQTLTSLAGDFLNDNLFNTSNRDYLSNLKYGNQQLYNFTHEGHGYNHMLEDKGYLSFHYPEDAYRKLLTPIQTHKVNGLPTFRLPFFENPKISESRAANYASHDIVNRNEPYRLWTSAKPLTLDLTFSITLPHLLEFGKTHLKSTWVDIMKQDGFRDQLIEILQEKVATTKNLPVGVSAGDFNEEIKDSYDWAKDRYGITAKILEGMEFGEYQSDATARTGLHQNRKHLTVYVMYLLNLVRSSVIGSTNIHNTATYRDEQQVNSDAKTAHDNQYGQYEKDNNVSINPDNPPYVQPFNVYDAPNEVLEFTDTPEYLPPPVVFLTYGALYNNDPFIITKYSMTFDGKEGYDELSLIPRHIKIKLTLESFDRFSNTDNNRGMSKLFMSPYAK